MRLLWRGCFPLLKRGLFQPSRDESQARGARERLRDWVRQLPACQARGATDESDEPCVVQIATTMSSRVYAPGELMPRRNLYVVERGVALYGGRVLSYGKVWGVRAPAGT